MTERDVVETLEGGAEISIDGDVFHMDAYKRIVMDGSDVVYESVYEFVDFLEQDLENMEVI